MNTKRIPITEAKRLAKTYSQNQVIIVTWDKVNNRQHVITYGLSVTDCAQAALGGNFVKKALGWPDEQCHDEPARVRRMKSGAPAVQTTNSRYETALSVLQEYYSSADFTVIDFRDWCKQRLPNSCKDKPAWLGTGNRTSAA